MKAGDKVFTLVLNTSKNHGSLNPKNLEIVEAVVISVDDAKETAVISFTIQGQPLTGEHRQEHLASSKIELDQHRHRVAFELIKRRVIDQLQKGTLPGSSLLPNFEPRFTGNSLRLKERNMGYSAQINTFGKTVSPQKIIQLIAIAVEMIEVLIDVQQLLIMCNDFAKRVLAKYITVELLSIYKLLERLAKLDSAYSSKYFTPFKSTIAGLETKYGYKFLRNKLGAHLDPELDLEKYIKIWEQLRIPILEEHWKEFHTHIDKALTDLYPHERKMYFLMRHHPIQGVLGFAKPKEQISFDSFEL